MGFWSFAAGVALTQVSLTFFISPAGAQPPSVDDVGPLDTLVANHEATVLKLQSCPLYAEYTWRGTANIVSLPRPDGEDLSGRMVSEGSARYWRDGTSFREERELKNTWPASGRVTENSNIFLINDLYALDYDKRLHTLDVYYFDHRKYLDAELKSKVEDHPYPDLLEFGTRYSTRETLREAYEKEVGGSQSGYRWTTLEFSADGRPYYIIKSEKARGTTRNLQRETVLDPSSGFLISESRTYNKTGTLFYLVRAQFQQVTEGMWFPKSITQDIEQGNNVMTIDVQNVTLGDPEIRRKITLEALNIDPEITIMCEHIKGGTQSVKKGYLNGNWVPFKLLPPERKKAIAEAQQR